MTPEDTELCKKFVVDVLEKLDDFKTNLQSDMEILGLEDPVDVDWHGEYDVQGHSYVILMKFVVETQEALSRASTCGYENYEETKKEIITRYEEVEELQKKFCMMCEGYMTPRR